MTLFIETHKVNKELVNSWLILIKMICELTLVYNHSWFIRYLEDKGAFG